MNASTWLMQGGWMGAHPIKMPGNIRRNTGAIIYHSVWLLIQGIG